MWAYSSHLVFNRKDTNTMGTQKEIWEDIVIIKNGILYDFTGKYQVSNLGSVRSLKYKGQSGHVHRLKPALDGRGYPYVVLYCNGAHGNFHIHRLVATAFIPNPDGLPIVNHIDEVKTNNHTSNLEWCTEKYNLEYGTVRARQSESKKGKFTGDRNPRARKVICLNNKQIFNTAKEAGEWCGVAPYGALIGANKTSGKHPETGERLRWMYYEDWLKLQEQ